ncbi:MAG: MAE_28990/MAE_18760 family HEPN-like nuclease [Cyanobacteriota bacterium]|nr:MAE_28990/MAE_18760 family HEPN-like nuclease [Cyanobacteriota bacterium]
MLEEITNKVRVSIATIRGVTKTNNRLREIASARENETLKELNSNVNFRELIEGLPREYEWGKYENSAVLTRLYAVYERFVEDLIKEWLQLLPNLVPNYSDLEARIKNTHREGVGRLLLELNKRRFQNLSPEKIVKGLCEGVTGDGEYELISEAFLLQEQNLRKDILEKLLADAGIYDRTWNWVKKHREVKRFVEENQENENTAEGELNQLIYYRNDAAHGFLDRIIGTQELLDLTYFIESLCQALAELVTYRIISLQTRAGEAREIGKITEWFKKPRAAVAIINDISLSVGDSLFLVSEESSYCRLATIESMKISDRSQQQLQITAATEVGLKFDLDAKKGLTVIAPPNSLN